MTTSYLLTLLHSDWLDTTEGNFEVSLIASNILAHLQQHNTIVNS